MSSELALRFVGGVLAGMGAWQAAFGLLLTEATADPSAQLLAVIFVIAASFGIGFLVTPYVTTRPFFWLLDVLTHLPPGDVVAGALGLVAGLLVGALLAPALGQLPWLLGQVLPVAASLVCGYLGVSTALAHRKALFGLLGLPWRLGPGSQVAESARVVVDTSAIIDGRIADIARTGFLPSTLVVPRFVLAELQRVADSPDPIRRGRGRRGLEILHRLQQDSGVELDLMDVESDGLAEVDAQLVSVAQALRCPIITNDFNLNRVAALQGVKVLNVNELANAVKSVVLPEESLTVRIVQEGREFGQGVGYLEDGTMVVVENGRHHLNSTLEVTVKRVLQTVAGRMIFAQPR